MSSARKASLKLLGESIKQSPGRCLNIATGQGIPGTRAAPAQTQLNDARIGSRLDNGDAYTAKDGKKLKRYKFQLNRNAQNATIKDLAKDSHKVWSYADVEIKENPTIEEAIESVDDMLAQLEGRMLTDEPAPPGKDESSGTGKKR